MIDIAITTLRLLSTALVVAATLRFLLKAVLIGAFLTLEAGHALWARRASLQGAGANSHLSEGQAIWLPSPRVLFDSTRAVTRAA